MRDASSRVHSCARHDFDHALEDDGAWLPRLPGQRIGESEHDPYRADVAPVIAVRSRDKHLVGRQVGVDVVVDDGGVGGGGAWLFLSPKKECAPPPAPVTIVSGALAAAPIVSVQTSCPGTAPA